MALKLNLRANERIVVNGAVMTALKPTSLLINNRVAVLLERQIMRPEHATTPARRIYFAVQCAYMADPGESAPFLDKVAELVGDFEGATGSTRARTTLVRIRDEVTIGRFYEALKLCRELMSYEEMVLGLAPLEGFSATPTPEPAR